MTVHLSIAYQVATSNQSHRAKARRDQALERVQLAGLVDRQRRPQPPTMQMECQERPIGRQAAAPPGPRRGVADVLQVPMESVRLSLFPKLVFVTAVSSAAGLGWQLEHAVTKTCPACAGQVGTTNTTQSQIVLRNRSSSRVSLL